MMASAASLFCNCIGRCAAGETPTILNPLAERPLRVSGVQHERTVKNLDLVPPIETYKVHAYTDLPHYTFPICILLLTCDEVSH